MATKKEHPLTAEEFAAAAKKHREELRKRLTSPILTKEQIKHMASLGKINIKRYQKKNGNETDNQ